MLYKQHAIAMSKPWSHTGSFGAHLHEIIAKLKHAIEIQIPTGYEDETGFHFGTEPVREKLESPQVL
jgi:hypothetical protein